MKPDEGEGDTGKMTAGGEKTERETTLIARNTGKYRKEKIVFKAVIVAWVPVSATKPIPGPCHTLCRLLPTLSRQ